MFKWINKPIIITETNNYKDDNFIVNVVQEFYNELIPVNNTDEKIKTLLIESLKESFSINLDYRNINIDTNVETLSSIIEDIESPLIYPLRTIYESIMDEDTLDRNYDNSVQLISESEIIDFVMALYEGKLLPDGFMDRYIELVSESVMESVDALMGINRGMITTESSGDDLSNSLNSVSVNMVYPNETILDSVIETTIDRFNSDGDYEAIRTNSDELETLVDDFMTDEGLNNLSQDKFKVYEMMRKLVDFIYSKRHKINEYCAHLYCIEKFRAEYIMFPIKLFHYTAVILSNILSEMMDNCKSNNFMFDKIQKTRKRLLSDMIENHNRVSMHDYDEEKYYSKLAEYEVDYLRDMRGNMSEIGLRLDCGFPNGDKSLLRSDFEPENSTRCRSIGTRPSVSIKSLTESFEVLDDGTIKVVVSRKTTYMDEYAENHRLLVANQKMGNYDAMKYNLVYDLILINNIEKNVMYNTKVSKDSPLYEDAIKARKFAKNDVSTYLPIVRQHCKNFDLNEFYKEVKAEESTIKINGVNTVKGIKNIIQAIMV